MALNIINRLDKTSSVRFIHEDRKIFHSHTKKVRRYGIILSNPSITFNKTFRATLQKNRKGGSRNTCLNDPNKEIRKTHHVEHVTYKISIYHVISLLKINFKTNFATAFIIKLPNFLMC